MSRKLTVSLLFGLGFLALTAFAQPPGGPPKKPAEKKAAEKKGVPDPLDGFIFFALANDADVNLARAKLQLAEAEVARARQLVAQKVVSVDSAIREQKKAVATAQQIYEISAQRYQSAAGALHDMLLAREKLETAQAKLAQLETEFKLLTGNGKRAAAAGPSNETELAAAHRNAVVDSSCVACHQSSQVGNAPKKVTGSLQKALSGPIPERIRAALDKSVKLGPKDAKITFEQALEIFKKDAGLDVPVRSESKLGPIVSLGEELPVGAWLQLFADSEDWTPGIRIVVREYGLLITTKTAAPPDAISVFDFWKQKPEKKP